MDKTIIKSLPESAGVYTFKVGKTPIYIGKAINLKRRVGSYFDLHLEPKTERMIAEANNFSYINVNSELEALLLEAKLINSYQPKYNSISKDDKHPLYIRITKEEFPRVITARKIAANEKNIAFFGPFPSSRNVYSVLRSLRRIFPYSDHKLGKRPCLYSHIGLCSPCPNEITQSSDKALLKKKYLANIRKIKSILNGRIDIVKKDLDRQMNDLSKKQKYEEAKLVRDQIQRLEYITQPRVPTEFYIQNPNLKEDVRRSELLELQKLLVGSFKIESLHRIECFDIAHLAGASPTASMVTFIEGEADKSEYRHFKIRQNKTQSDYDSMREVARRRLKQAWDKPNLIIVDGGVGQLNVFKSIIKGIPIVGIAKGPDRLILNEKEKVRLSGPTLSLVQRIRDEAHRFARRYHHTLISKSLLK